MINRLLIWQALPVSVYDADRMSVDTKWVLNEIVIDDVFVLKSDTILINTTT